MKFLLDADLSPRMVLLFAEHGHSALHVEAIFPARTPDINVANFARDNGCCLVTGDYDFADIREYEPQRYDGIAVLMLPRNAGPAYITDLIREFLGGLEEFGSLRGKLLIVEPGRIRVRE